MTMDLNPDSGSRIQEAKMLKILLSQIGILSTKENTYLLLVGLVLLLGIRRDIQTGFPGDGRTQLSGSEFWTFVVNITVPFN